MSTINRRKVEKAKRAGGRKVSGVYKRTRQDENGKRAQQRFASTRYRAA